VAIGVQNIDLTFGRSFPELVSTGADQAIKQGAGDAKITTVFSREHGFGAPRQRMGLRRPVPTAQSSG
jgi:hypothetical protein